MTTVNGLPAHILLVHAVVVLLPLSALLLILTALWPAARVRLALPNALLSLVVVAIVPLTTSAGEWLERRVPRSSLLQHHTDLGDNAIFFAIPIAALALVVWWRDHETRARRAYLAPNSTTVTAVVAVLAIAAGLAGVYGIYLIGDSGSKAAWNGVAQNTPAAPDHH